MTGPEIQPVVPNEPLPAVTKRLNEQRFDYNGMVQTVWDDPLDDPNISNPRTAKQKIEDFMKEQHENA